MTAINAVADLSMEGDVAVLTLNSPPVNALSAGVREGIAVGIAQALADPAARSVVLICEGRTFIAGADITEFGGAQKGPGLFEVQTAIDGVKDAQLHVTPTAPNADDYESVTMQTLLQGRPPRTRPPLTPAPSSPPTTPPRLPPKWTAHSLWSAGDSPAPGSAAPASSAWTG